MLLYHVVAGRVPSSKVVMLKSAKTLNGKSVRIHTAGGTVFVNDAKVTKADINASNGDHPRREPRPDSARALAVPGLGSLHEGPRPRRGPSARVRVRQHRAAVVCADRAPGERDA